MRNKYPKDFEEKMIKLASKKTLSQLLDIAKNKYNYNITKKQLMAYLSKRQIRYKDYNKNKVRDIGSHLPLFSERVRPDGMVQVKISKNKWEYKQRYIYSRYYNKKLTDDDYIIFLDQDRTNFNIDNLKLITRHESSILSNQQLYSKDSEITKTGIQIAKLMIKLKEVSK